MSMLAGGNHIQLQFQSHYAQVAVYLANDEFDDHIHIMIVTTIPLP